MFKNIEIKYFEKLLRYSAKRISLNEIIAREEYGINRQSCQIKRVVKISGNMISKYLQKLRFSPI